MDEELTKILRDAISVSRSGRQRSTGEALMAITQDFTRKQALGHGRYPVELDSAAARELEARADEWFDISRTVLVEGGLGWTKSVAVEMESLLRGEVTRDWEELYGRIQQKETAMTKTRVAELVAAQDRANVKLKSQLDRAVLAQDRSTLSNDQLLASPRYVSIQRARNKARDFLAAEPPDLANGTKEAVAAVEQLARLVIGQPKKTLGEAIKVLRQDHDVPPPILKGLEELWGWASTTEGVRHGAGELSTRDRALARYIVAQCDAALAYLATLDAP